MIHHDLQDTMMIMIQKQRAKEDIEHIHQDQQGKKREAIEGEEIRKEEMIAEKKRKVQNHVQAKADHTLDPIGEREEMHPKKIHIPLPDAHVNAQQRMTVI